MVRKGYPAQRDLVQGTKVKNLCIEKVVFCNVIKSLVMVYLFMKMGWFYAALEDGGTRTFASFLFFL